MCFILGLSVLRAQTKPQLWDVRIQGNEAFHELLLFDVIASKDANYMQKWGIRRKKNRPFDELEVRRDVIRLRRFYDRRGFSKAQVRYEVETGGKLWKKNVTFFINEGPPLLLSSFTWEMFGDEVSKAHYLKSEAFQKQMDRLELKKGARFERVKIPEYESEILQTLRDLGAAFGRVNISFVEDSASYSVSAHAELRPGPVARVDSMLVIGNKTTPASIPRREAEIQVGDIYSQKNVEKSQRELYYHHLYQFATVYQPEQPEDSTVTLQVRVEEYPLRSIELRGGLGNEDLLRGQVVWTHRNINRRAHSFSASVKASFIEQRTSLNYFIPYVFNNKSSNNLTPFAFRLQERSFRLVSYGINNSLVYQFSPELTTTVAYEFTNNSEDGQLITNRRNRNLNFDLSTLTFSGLYNFGVFSSSNTWFLQPTYQISGVVASSTFRFQKATLELRNYTSLTRTTQFATRLNTGVIFNVLQDTLPTSTLLFLGGTSSVRGFGRQQLGPKRAVFKETDQGLAFDKYIPTGGDLQLAFNLEIRQELNQFIRGFGFAVFLDGGQIWEDKSGVSLSSLQYSTGLGLRYRTPIGPVRVDFGYILNPTDEDLNIFQGQDFGGSMERWGIHFSLGQAF